MTQLTLVSKNKRPLKPLVEAALKKQLHLLESSIRRSQQNLKQFEEKHGLTTPEFPARQAAMGRYYISNLLHFCAKVET